jgi:hypothetical protein
MRDFAKKGYALEIKNSGYERELDKISTSISFLAFCFIAGVCIFSGVFLISGKEIHVLGDIPTLTWILWSSGLFLFASGLKK